MRRLILTTIAIGAAAAIVALLGADADPVWKVTGTSFSVTGAALVSLPAVAAWEREKLGWLPIAGIGAAIGGFGLAVYAIWAEPGGVVLFKLPLTLVIIAVGIAAICLVEFARLDSGLRWILTATRLMLGVVAAMLIVALWAELEGDGFWRGFGVTAVLLTALLAAIPILHRAERTADSVDYCPVCGGSSPARIGQHATCPACGRRYRVLT